MVLPHQTKPNPSTSTDDASPSTSTSCSLVRDAKPEASACSAAAIAPAKPAVIAPPIPAVVGSTVTYIPRGRRVFSHEKPLKTTVNPERPWRDIPLAEFPAGMESWSGLAQPDWICGPCVCSDVSTDTEAGNFHVLWNRLCELGASEDWDLLNAVHWTAGNVELVFVRPGSPAHALCDDIRRELACFPDLTKCREEG